MEPKQLMKKGEREVASYIKQECCRSGGDVQLNELLDFLLDPSKGLDGHDRLKWCKALIAGGVTFEEFAKTVTYYDDATVCGLVWTKNFVAYRCRTCGISPCMSLCSDCFHAGDHSGHDFNMFRSGAGGACDCGDSTVMNPIGFCTRHGPNRPKQEVPSDLIKVADLMMPRLLIRLVQHLRDNSPHMVHDSYVVSMPELEQFIDFLQKLSDMGAAMKTIITKAMLDSHVYEKLQKCAFGAQRRGRYQTNSQEKYQTALKDIKVISVPHDFCDIEEILQSLDHTSLLEELYFWSVKYEFPQKLVNFMLSLLPNDRFKDAFTCCYVKHYGYMTTVLMNVHDKLAMCNSIVHISVQLLSPPALASKMVRQYHLLHIIICSFRHLINSLLVDAADSPKGSKKTIDCANAVLKEHSYWPLVSDLINLFSHRDVALYFMSDSTLLTHWASIMACFQGMNLNVRELMQHVEYEPEYYYSAFSAELEICSSTMWSLLIHLNDESTVAHTRNVLVAFGRALEQWFSSSRINRFTIPHPLEMSFHYPLHRYFAAFLYQAINVQHVDIEDIIPPPGFLHTLMIHPLHLMVCYYEILAGMWVRNGHQIRGQAMTYIQSHFCKSTVDVDIYLLQVIASRLDPDYMIHTIFDRFHVLDLLTFSSSTTVNARRNVVLSRDHELPMLESALTFLCMILGERTKLGLTPAAVTRLEMVGLLCVMDRTHSQLIDAIPETCGVSHHDKDYESVIQQVADFKTAVVEPGGTLQQGRYVPKGDVWVSEYDPLHVMLRAVYRRDIQQSVDRYTEFIKQQGLYQRSGNPWPPFRIPRLPHNAYLSFNKLLHCRTMHGVLFTLLYKAVNEKTITEAIVYYTVHLLELAVNVPNPDAGRKKILIEAKQLDKQFCSWFASDCILTNLPTVISQVMVDEYRLHVPSTEVALATNVGRGSTNDYDDVIAVNDDGDDIDFPAPVTGAIDYTAATTFNKLAVVPTNAVENVDAVQLEMDPDDVAAASQRYQSRGVTAGASAVTVGVPVAESMLTLLLQLFRRFSRAGVYRLSLLAQAESGVAESRVGDGEFFIRKVLDSVCAESAECADVISSLCQQPASDGDTAEQKETRTEDKDERRQKAKQRQEKLMKEFASKQKEFMEKVVGASEMDIGLGEVEEPEEQLFDCCICSQCTPSTNERLVGLVTLLQPSSVLGHRRHCREPANLPVSDSMFIHDTSTFAEEFKERFCALKSEFDETSCSVSVNIGWEGGVYAQSCGHYLHLDCHKSYVQALTGQAVQGLVLAHREFWCPMCRQLANTVLPIMPGAGGCTDTDRLVPDTEPALVRHVADVLQAPYPQQTSRDMIAVLTSVMDDLILASGQVHKQFIGNSITTGPFVFVCSILRSNLEFELDQRGGSPCLSLPASIQHKKKCTSLLHQILSLHSKMLTVKSCSELWSNITGLAVTTDSNSLTVYQKDVPLLLHDVGALLIQLVLSMPLTMSKSAFQCIVRALYNLLVVQFATSVSCKLSVDEQKAWLAKDQAAGCTKLESLLSRVIGLLSGSLVFYRDMLDSQRPAICADVWSPMSIEAAGVEHVLPFVRICALLQFHLFHDSLPSLATLDSNSEFTHLARYVGLAPRDYSSSQLSAADCVCWHSGDVMSALGLIETWCRQLAVRLTTSSHLTIRMLLTASPTWYPARLMTLPHQYEVIFDFYRRRHCSVCNTLPDRPAVCLVCGQLVCHQGRCCERGGTQECVQHSRECGSGTAMFLIINSSLILIVRGPRAAIWGSVYLDAHSEEDRELKRGKPLHLSEERYKLLEQLWTLHSFDHACKQWRLHTNRL